MRIKCMTMLKAVVVGMVLPVVGNAQTSLRWNLGLADKIGIEVTQQTTCDVAYAGKKTTTQIDLTMRLGWEVVSVEAGRIRIKQTLTGVTMRMESPEAGRVEFDSAQTTRPTGRNADLAAAIGPLLASSLEMTMNERGEVLEAKPATEPAEKQVGSADDAMKPPLLTKEMVQQLLRQPLALLPEKPVYPDETWTTQTELKTPLGQARQATTYRYMGPIEEDGIKLDRISVVTTLQLGESSASTKLKIKEHQQTGTILFSSATGRLVHAEQTQKLLTERPYRETTIVVTLVSKQQTVVGSAEKR
jgi:uncharacterized protein DUF6263